MESIQDRACPIGTLRRRFGGIAIAVLLLSTPGCGVMRVLYAPQFTEHKSITLTVRRDTTAVAVSDTFGVAPPAVAIESQPGEIVRLPVPVAATKPSAPPRSSVSTPPDTLSQSHPEATEQPSIAVPASPPSVSIAIPEEQRERLERLTRAELVMAESIVGQIAPRLRTDRDREKLRTVNSLIEATHAALDRDDIQAAANLAHKAKLLATEFLSR